MAPTILARSPVLMSAADTGLLVVDVQGKLITLVPGYKRIIWNISRLLDAAELLGVPVAGTEQYPKGLGGTVPELAPRLGKIAAKTAFSCASCSEITERFAAQNIHKVLVVGIEAHVCIQQTVFDLMASGLRVYIAVDAVGSRHEVDYQTALRRMEGGGAVLTSTEAAMFEWCGDSSIPQFKEISRLVQQSPPVDG